MTYRLNRSISPNVSTTAYIIIRPLLAEARNKNTFPKRSKLRNQSEFKAVFDKAQRSSDAYFTVLARVQRTHHARLGLAISAKRIKTAVARNRVKRLVRESFRNHKDTLHNLDIVVLARADLSNQSNQRLLHSLATHWSRLTKLCKNFSSV